MKHGLVRDGELVVSEAGDAVLQHLLPAGRWSHVWSTPLAGALRSPFFAIRPPVVFSAELAAGRFAAESFIVDHAFHSERMQFPNVPRPAWRTLKAGDFDTLEGGIDTLNRRVYLEWVTKSLNNYFPPRTGYGGVKESDLADESSWFGVSRVYRHAAGKPPRDELGRFAAFFEQDIDWEARIAAVITAAVSRWARDGADADDGPIAGTAALELGLLSNSAPDGPELHRLLGRYRETEKALKGDRTLGSVAEWRKAVTEDRGSGSVHPVRSRGALREHSIPGGTRTASHRRRQRSPRTRSKHRERLESIDRPCVRESRLVASVRGGLRAHAGRLRSPGRATVPS